MKAPARHGHPGSQWQLPGARRWSLIGLVLIEAWCAAPARAQSSALPPLPYTTRTSAFSGYRNTVSGDMRTVGMAGAVVGLTDGFVSSVQSPSGLAMSQRGVSLQFVGNRIRDGQLGGPGVSSGGTPIGGNEQVTRWLDFGLATGAYPWGFSVGRWRSGIEEETFAIASLSGQLRLRNEVDEYRFSAARVFAKDRLSIGATVVAASATREIESVGSGIPAQRLTTQDWGLALGTTLRLKDRLLVAATFQTPLTFAGDPARQAPVIAGFFQPVRTPWRADIGMGWWLSRIFRVGASVAVVGPSRDTALLADTSRLTGIGTLLQPRLGASYTWIEKRNVRAHVSLGTYFEDSRVVGQPARLHATGALDFDLSVFNLGWGIDAAPRYSNWIVVAGIDVVRTLRALKLAPKERPIEYRGYLPDPFERSDEGLARSLVRDWRPHMEGLSLFELGRDLPGRLEDRIRDLDEMLKPELAPKQPSLLDPPPTRRRPRPRDPSLLPRQ